MAKKKSGFRARRVRTTSKGSVPVNVRLSGLDLDEDARAYMLKWLATKFRKFEKSVVRVTVRLRDVNGPRGGIDQRCSIKVVLTGQASVVVERQAATARAAFNGALTGAEGAVRQHVRRARDKRG